MPGHVTDYKSIPALAKYIDRIGAEQLNFRRFMVKEHRGKYYTEKCVIMLKRNGEMTITNKEYAPTKEEKEHIKGALMEAEWPRSIPAKTIDSLLKQEPKLDKSQLAEFWSRKERGIIMIQQRIENKKEGTKDYVPWSLWSDNKWRMMEPDGKLPFWKPKEKQSSLIMIHEGAKAAIHVNWMITSSDPEAKRIREAHPWFEDLQSYEHWGIIGGALAPHRADYDELRHEKPVDVVYVCDNDWPGKAALQEVSNHFKGTLKGVRFDSKWPASFDLGDPMDKQHCPRLYNAEGKYNGPAFRSLMEPATWATEMVFSGDKGRPNIIIRRQFREEWLHAIEPEVFIHRDMPNKLHTASKFNSAVAPFSDVDDTARLLRKDYVGKGARLSYEPGKKPGLYGSDDKGWFINTHVPSHIRKVKGDYKLWQTFMGFLVPDEDDRKEFERWIATLIARPDIKMHYGVLMVSETQGVGKTTLGDKVLRPIIGDDNVSVPQEHQITDSSFNSWAAHKRLCIISEIYAGHSSKAYDRLKSIITDHTIGVNMKYRDEYYIQNWVHMLASSNSQRALKISADDRRWFIPKITEQKQSWDWWEKFNKWLRDDDGLGKIIYWAEEFLKKNEPVKTGEAAPWSTIKQEIVEEGMSPGLQYLSGVLDIVKEELNGHNFIFSDTQLVGLIKDKFYEGKNNDKLERPLTVRKLAKAKGFYISKDRHKYKAWGTFDNPRLICSSVAVADLKTQELVDLGLSPLDLKAIIEKHEKM